MELISVHVAKTAGTTFGRLLDGIYGESSVCRDYTDVDLREISGDARAIHGHFSPGKYHGLYPEARRVAWVRHPAAWVISVYHYAKHLDRGGDTLQRRLHDEGLSLEEYATHPLVRNPYTRNYLYGCELEAFFFLGVHEEFRDDLRDLAGLMGWRVEGVGAENVNPEPGYREKAARLLADRALVRRIEVAFDADMDLYRRVLALRRARLRGSRRSTFRWPWASPRVAQRSSA